MYFFLMTSQQGNASLFDLLTPFIVIFFIMWFLVIRPQKKEQKKRQEMLDSIKKGDKIVTNGGIVGKITKIKENKIEVKVDDSNNVKITDRKSVV